MRILTWQPMIQTEIGLPLTVVCLHTPPAVQRVYMRHRHGSSSCLSSGQKICLFSLTCHSETRWGRLEFIESVSSYRKSCMRLMTCVSVMSSGDSPWRGLEWDVPPVCHPVVPAHGQLSSSDSARSFSHAAGQDLPPHSWAAHLGGGLPSLQVPGCWSYWVCLPESHCAVQARWVAIPSVISIGY